MIFLSARERLLAQEPSKKERALQTPPPPALLFLVLKIGSISLPTRLSSSHLLSLMLPSCFPLSNEKGGGREKGGCCKRRRRSHHLQSPRRRRQRHRGRHSPRTSNSWTRQTVRGKHNHEKGEIVVLPFGFLLLIFCAATQTKKQQRPQLIGRSYQVSIVHV